MWLYIDLLSMAAPSYTTDLTDLLTDMPLTTGWTALGGGAGGLVAPETDFFIQGSNCISKAGWSSATKGMIYNMGSGQTVAGGKAIFMWIYYWAPNSMATETNGGMQLLIGSATSAFKQWYIRGSDTLVYGGWVCAVVDPTITADATTGSPTATLQYFGAQANIPSSGPSKGQPLGIDAIRHGRDFTCTNGDVANGYATFSGAAAYNDDVSRRYGQIQAIDGGFLQQGRFLMGTPSTAVDFRDSNKTILVARTNKVSASFNTFEVQNALSRVDWTNISLSALGTTARGNFVTTDNADINFDSCAFTDLGIFGFQSNSTILSSTFRRCNLITQTLAAFTNCAFDSTNDSIKALLVNDPSKISACSFISGGTKHAIEISVPGTYTFSGNTFSGYGSTGTADAAIYNNSGGAVTLNITGGGDASPTYRNGAGASTTIVAAVDLTVTVVDKNNAPIQNAQTAIYLSSSDAELMNEDTDINGIAAASYSGSTPANIYVRIRKSSTGSTKYYPASTTGTITASGFSATITLIEDTTA
ncbi:hypothetical protein COX59_03195 [Candidatus Beckwithbacteria bacterium CG_4_10_14_0_2_um_filter_47_25]|uniref:Uncharacterized protein n=2 Tax=Candidatus Beckwithiibacteriota TaxID=1752726 RepID=A0A2M8G2Z2_9BACT|nr:MAG: hypothetical protein COX59_03195 [Candidatus Beckwithbacteria bacterium CG_4_10_14_0_2_um_filter_47_25]PJC66010.1 MAG: hypothetical protein CO018_04185 [Candidatus Beckwithbacteria bacterium CG_4_9_14_0_2_um_filter_47_11]